MLAWFGYRLFSWVASPFVLVWWFTRMVLNPPYRQNWLERFGWVTLPDMVQPLWVHAVSVGEIITIAPMVHRIQAEHPNVPIVVTVMTPTGAEQARKRMPKGIVLRYMPFDMTGAVRRFMKRVNPRCLLLVETELWPNMLWRAHKMGVPVVLANARLSQKSYRGYARIIRWVQSALAGIVYVGAQTEDDANRFMALGIDPKRIHVMGNVKYDIEQDAQVREQADRWRTYLSEHKWVLAASTHAGEEDQCISAFKALHGWDDQVRLCIAPRHPHRIPEVTKLCEQHGLRVVLRSCLDLDKPWQNQGDVLLVDTLGELCVFYGAMPVAFIGGSLITQGGHNPIEALDMGCAVITGPHVFNFAEIYRLLRDQDGCYFIKDAKTLAEAWGKVLVEKHTKIKAGQAVVSSVKGSTDRHLAALSSFL